MTLTLWTSDLILQQSARGAPDGALSAALARVVVTDGATDLTSETTRRRLFSASNAFPSGANGIGRLVTCSLSPPSGGSLGTRKFDFRTFRTVDADAGGAWIELEGFRAEDTGTGIQVTVHAAATFTAASANFPTDEAPAILRTNTGPSIWCSLYTPDAANLTLRWLPWTITQRTNATTVRVSDPFGLLLNIPTETTMRWLMRRRPMMTADEIPEFIHRFLLQCGYTLEQFRGRNNGAGAGRNLIWDTVYRSTGESGRTLFFPRLIGMQSTASGFRTASTPAGFDIAVWQAWDRTHPNASPNNPGQGTNAVAANTRSGGNGLASVADIANAATSRHPIIGQSFGWSGLIPTDVGFGAGPATLSNTYGTPFGGELCQVDYVFVGDRDSVELYLYIEGSGRAHVSFGQLQPRPEATQFSMITNDAITVGAGAELRVGGAPGNPTDDGINPLAPPTGPALAVGDRLQIAGTTVNSTITAGTSHSGEHVESTTITGFPGLRAARGQLVHQNGTATPDGETFTIYGTTFEYDKNATVSGGNTPVPITNGWTADQVRDAAITAIMGVLSATVTASSGGTATTSLVRTAVGGVGNVPITQSGGAVTVATGMRGGGYSITVAAAVNAYAPGALVGEDPQPNYVSSFYQVGSDTTDGFSTQGSIALSNRAGFNDATYRDSNGPAVSGGLGFDAVLTRAGASDFLEGNPNQRSGRFLISTLVARDTVGGQLRGSLKWAKLGNVRMGKREFRRARDGTYYLLVPYNFNRATTSESSGGFVLCFGPIPASMIQAA
jgi:hypothetical protein